MTTPHFWLPPKYYCVHFISFVLFFNALILFHLCLRKCVSMSTCDDRACPRLNMVTLSQRQGSLTPSESQNACWFFDIERGADKATHQMSNDWKDCRRNGFWQSAIYNLLAIPHYLYCPRLPCCHLFLKKITVIPTYILLCSFIRHTLNNLFFLLIKKRLLRK